MKLSNSRIGMVVAAIITAAALAPSVVLGYSVRTQPPNAGTLSQASGGDTLLFPIYTTAGSGVDPVTGDPVTAITSFSVTNTSSTQTILAKIRFREQMNCVDALDFHVVLSPSDKFDFWVGKGDDGHPVMQWKDNSCVVGPRDNAGPGEVRTQRFPEPWKPFVSSAKNLEVGHLEVLGLVDLSKVPALRDAAKHKANGVPANCAKLRGVIGDPDRVYELNTATGSAANDTAGYLLDAGNVLVGRYAITVPGVGLEAGGDAIAIRDGNLARPRKIDAELYPNGCDGDSATNDPPAIGNNFCARAECTGGADPTVANNYCGRWNTRDAMWHVTAQSGKDCDKTGTATMMNCRTNNQYAWDGREWDHPHLGEIDNLPAFQQGLSAKIVAGDWSNNAVNHVGFDWIFSFPVKYAYLDYLNDGGNPVTTVGSGGKWRLLKHPKARDEPASNTDADSVWSTNGAAKGVTDLALTTQLEIYNTEEANAGEVLQVSPGGGGQLEMGSCVNIFTITTGNSVEPSWIQSADNRREINISDFNLEDLGAVRGWANLTVDWPTAATAGAATGLLWTVRATEDPTINNASLTELQKNIE